MLNRVELLGYLGNSPNYRVAKNGLPVSNFRLATTETYTQNGEIQEHTEWHTVLCFGKLAELVRDRLKTGSKVYVEGALRTRKWDPAPGDTDVEKRVTEIRASKVIFF